MLPFHLVMTLIGPVPGYKGESGALVLGKYLFHLELWLAREQIQPAPAPTPGRFWGLMGELNAGIQS